ncbi:hypothetical protein [Paenibacillus sp. P46E]|uniref:PKD domain-containing protein n=1 Tax=Paenibacillus sp. P46E TaxID=1349436 RepID=UPI00093A9C19|nr:hypothetical protein [Paenibacillus sp. P46E]OKP97429.1 hypothetical protein A3849_16315 [Paenibacillus sp. P46E]
MIKKSLIISFSMALFLALLVPSLTYSAQDPNVKSTSVAIPVNIGLTGSGNAAKSFSLDLPSGLTTSSIKTSTLKYSGNNTVIDNIGVENGKIKINLKGNEKAERFSVKGTDGRFTENFLTVPGNSIWRYSDGRRWQINDYDENRGVNFSYNVNATDSLTPSGEPPKRTVTTKADPVVPSTATWYKDEANKIDYSSVIPSSIQIVALPLINGSGSATVQNNKFSVSQTIPSNNFVAEKVSDSFEKGPWVLGRLYYANVPYYFSGQAQVKSYSYAGTVTFDYKLPTEPTLTGEVGLIDPNPNPARASGSDIPVKISIKGLLSAYQNSSNIEEWVFFAKETGNEASLKTKKDQAKVFTSQQSFDFLISKTKTNVPNFTQNYTLTVTVRFAQPVITAGGSVSSLSETFTINASTYTGPGPSTTPPPTSGPGELYPPFARITAPTKVKGGQSFIVSGANSFDKDGTIVSYKWEQPNANEALYGKSSDTSYPLSLIGTTQTITLTVTDNSGLTGTTSQDVEVVAPVPAPYLTVGGTLKENRKVSLHNETRVGPDDFPLVPAKTKFKIEWLEGNGSNADIKYSGSLIGIDDVDFLVKSPGKYRVSLYVENTAGYGATATRTLTISPDEAPIPYISIPSGAYRDPSDGNRAKVVLDDLSISPDFDYLAHRFWQYRYDSDNDGNFNEENWVVISDANLDRVTFYLTEVGRYEFRLTLTEEFGQPTIDKFVTAADRRTANTDSQATTEKIITVYNRKPVTDWTW